MKNYTTPRTLAECTFDTGYPVASVQSRLNSIAGYLLAIGIGASLTLLVAYSI
jgi:hypothetical protein